MKGPKKTTRTCQNSGVLVEIRIEPSRINKCVTFQTELFDIYKLSNGRIVNSELEKMKKEMIVA
jgi:hypothetical protein